MLMMRRSSCAVDVASAVRSMGHSVDAVVGHSFGGKVCVETLCSGRLPHEPAALGVVLDTYLGVWDALGDSDRDAVAKILTSMRSIRDSLSRDLVVAHFKSAGFSPQMQNWASSVVRCARSPHE